MTQTNANILLYSQAIALLQQLETATSDGSTQNVNDITTQLASTITQFEKGAAQPIFKFNKFVFGEPPLSNKINKMWNDIAIDLNIIGNQLDILRAAAVITYNTLTTELQQCTNLNDEIHNLVANIALYSNVVDSKTFIFSDNFATGGFIDSSFSIGDNLAQTINGTLTLGGTGQNKNLMQSVATISILPSSNGFPGDNQEIEDPTNAPKDPTTGDPQYTFVGQTNDPNSTQTIIDNMPNTFFEYENYLVQQSDRQKAQDFNFTYSTYSLPDQYPNSVNNQIDWASGPSTNILNLFLQIDLGTVQSFNSITYNPYGLANNVNFPILMQSVSTSSDGTTWTNILKTPTWIGTVVNQQAASVSGNVSIGSQTFNLNQQTARYILFKIQQPNPLPCNIGHLYYLDPKTQQREAGPVPAVNDPTFYYSSGQSLYNGLLQKTEYFKGQRWAIGIGGIAVNQNQYFNTSTMVTKRIYVTGTIDRVALDADVQVPNDFDTSTNWVTFWVSPDDGVTWYQISPIQDNLNNISEIIAFNDPLPAQFKEPNVTYASTNSPVTFLRFKIRLSSPASITNETPVVNDYQLKIRLQ